MDQACSSSAGAPEPKSALPSSARRSGVSPAGLLWHESVARQARRRTGARAYRGMPIKALFSRNVCIWLISLRIGEKREENLHGPYCGYSL